MKKTFFILFGVLALTFNSCMDESREFNEAVDINVRSEKSDCSKFMKKVDLFVPDTKEDFQYFKDLKDPKNLSEEDVEKYINLLGFKDVESLYENLVVLSKDDCLAKAITENSKSNKAGCSWNLFNCVLNAISDFGHGTNNAFLEIVDFILDVFSCAADFNDCVE